MITYIGRGFSYTSTGQRYREGDRCRLVGAKRSRWHQSPPHSLGLMMSLPKCARSIWTAQLRVNQTTHKKDTWYTTYHPRRVCLMSDEKCSTTWNTLSITSKTLLPAVGNAHNKSSRVTLWMIKIARKPSNPAAVLEVRNATMAGLFEGAFSIPTLTTLVPLVTSGLLWALHMASEDGFVQSDIVTTTKRRTTRERRKIHTVGLCRISSVGRAQDSRR